MRFRLASDGGGDSETAADYLPIEDFLFLLGSDTLVLVQKVEKRAL
jgi:hypothetical protein